MKIFLWFVVLITSYFIVIILSEELLNIDHLVYNSLSEKLTAKEITKIFEYQDKTKWLNYVVFPLILLIKTSLIASTLYIGTFFFSKIKVAFKQLWAIVVRAEFVECGFLDWDFNLYFNCGFQQRNEIGRIDGGFGNFGILVAINCKSGFDFYSYKRGKNCF